MHSGMSASSNHKRSRYRVLGVYQERKYREKASGHALVEQTLIDQESDLQIYSSVDVSAGADGYLKEVRQILQEYIARRPVFQTSLEPIDQDIHAEAVIQKMIGAAQLAEVGPMAAVAGAVSEYVGTGLLDSNPDLTDIFIENGGDIFIRSSVERRILIHAGTSVLSEKVAVKIKPEMTPCGICTSSGTVGHSLSFGKADAVVIISRNTCLADATATSAGNKVKSERDIEKAIEWASQIDGIEGILIIVGDKIGAWGNIELC